MQTKMHATKMRRATTPPTAMPAIAPRVRILWGAFAASAAAVMKETISTSLFEKSVPFRPITDPFAGCWAHPAWSAVKTVE
jgi:hypothetical protein